MTSRERLLTTLTGGIPDCVPVAPDFSNMIPARLTGKPFWDIYLYNDPPIWEAYIDCVKRFGIDSLMDGYFSLSLPEEDAANSRGNDGWERFIVFRSDERIVTQASRVRQGGREWATTVDVYYVADSPTGAVDPAKIGLPAVPTEWEPLEGVKPVDHGPSGLKRVKELMGDHGLIGVFVAFTSVLVNTQQVYDYYDDPGRYEGMVDERIAAAEERFHRIMALDVLPDFLCVGGSGTLVFQTVDIFRKIGLPVVKRVIELATDAGMPTQIHSCGPEKELVRIMAEETSLTAIDPLEPPPMGDCDLAELKRLYGDKIVLKGNLHTTDVMLYGSVDDVIAASKKAIDDAGEGGGFILSTGDQCGRDTPLENLHAMVDTARTYGKY